MVASAFQAPVPFARTEISPEVRQAAQLVLESDWVSEGPQTGLFEREIADRVGGPACDGGEFLYRCDRTRATSNSTAHRSLVMVPTLTFCGAAQAVVHAGLLPLLVDVDPGTGMPSAATAARAAADFGQPQALMVLRLRRGALPAGRAGRRGQSADVPDYRGRHPRFGTYAGYRPVGALSQAACFSCYATKNLPIGEAGMVTTDDDDLAEPVRRARLHGMSADARQCHLPGGTWQYTVDDAGPKANMAEPPRTKADAS
ncbi:DegT/DnrJ/EryC1/StrS family aminotransferase [Streptacidiphilus carbonis]|jgi:dTDP-4-amino-4,6-dideoxygalactose transaminase|uniref:DegT/DnrJ/EryC1/StrS family aminotransferase n=1 Tax=Streptacidiphilus carbonis TaxID=105422 RepID=UPI00069418E0|nr:DegT/DnrJ/EryC1/StrS family aminotransferase [Streptacidiphilus carbonis]